LRVVIYLGLLLPEASSGTLQSETGKRPTLVSFDLASDWGLPSQHLSMLLVRSYRTFAPLPKISQHLWRYVSVALSSRSPALGVTQQSGLWKPGLSSILCGTHPELQLPRQLSFYFLV